MNECRRFTGSQSGEMVWVLLPRGSTAFCPLLTSLSLILFKAALFLWTSALSVTWFYLVHLGLESSRNASEQFPFLPVALVLSLSLVLLGVSWTPIFSNRSHYLNLLTLFIAFSPDSQVSFSCSNNIHIRAKIGTYL